MALQINTSLTTNDGGTVDSGAYVVFATFFPESATNYNVNLKIYRDAEAYNNGLTPLRGVLEIPTTNFDYDIVDISTLTLVDVNTSVLNRLESYVGSGNVSVV
jgi:hypothetical protein